jgi:hypothetical protein
MVFAYMYIMRAPWGGGGGEGGGRARYEGFLPDGINVGRTNWGRVSGIQTPA